MGRSRNRHRGQDSPVQDVKRIVSYHNLAEFPADLEEIYERMCQQDADVFKFVVAAQSPADNLRMIEIMKKATKPTIAFCSGDLGFPTRILCLKYGALVYIRRI